MRETLRRAFVRSVGFGLFAMVALTVAVVMSGELMDESGFLIALFQPLMTFAWATVLSLTWWVSLAAFVAAFAIAHRHNAPPEAGLPPPEASGAEDR